jgi:magnesium transporter
VIAETQKLFETIKTALRSDDSTVLSGVVSDIHAADIAEVYEGLDDEDRSRLFIALPPRTAAEVVVLLEEADRGEIVEDMDAAALASLVSGMRPDDAADVLGELRDTQRQVVFERLSGKQREGIARLSADETKQNWPS